MIPSSHAGVNLNTAGPVTIDYVKLAADWKD
jgi:hypothetical protein